MVKASGVVISMFALLLTGNDGNDDKDDYDDGNDDKGRGVTPKYLICHMSQLTRHTMQHPQHQQ